MVTEVLVSFLYNTVGEPWWAKADNAPFPAVMMTGSRYNSAPRPKACLSPNIFWHCRTPALASRVPKCRPNYPNPMTIDPSTALDNIKEGSDGKEAKHTGRPQSCRCDQTYGDDSKLISRLADNVRQQEETDFDMSLIPLWREGIMAFYSRSNFIFYILILLIYSFGFSMFANFGAAK